MENPFYNFFEDYRMQEAEKRQKEFEELYDYVLQYGGDIGLQKYQWMPMVVEVLENLRDARYPQARVPLRFFMTRPSWMVTDRYSKNFDWSIKVGEGDNEEAKVAVSLVFDENYRTVGFAVKQPYSSRVIKAGLDRESLVNALKELHTVPKRLQIYKQYSKSVSNTMIAFLREIQSTKYEYRIGGMPIPASEDDFSDIMGLPEHVGDWRILRKQVASTLFSQKEDEFQEIGFVRMILDQSQEPECFDVYLNRKKTRTGLSENELFQALIDLQNHPLKWGETPDETKSILYQMEARSRR